MNNNWEYPLFVLSHKFKHQHSTFISPGLAAMFIDAISFLVFIHRQQRTIISCLGDSFFRFDWTAKNKFAPFVCLCPSTPAIHFCFKGIIGRCEHYVKRYWINKLEKSLHFGIIPKATVKSPGRLPSICLARQTQVKSLEWHWPNAP